MSESPGTDPLTHNHIAMKKNEILKIYGTDYKRMTKELLENADLAEIIAADSDVRNARIGIKPNLVCPSPAQFGATTHPEVVAGIIEYLKEHGFENILIAEGSWIGDRTEDAFEYCGYRALCEEYGVPFIDTKKCKSLTVDVVQAEEKPPVEEAETARPAKTMDSMEVTDITKQIDFLINVPVLKGHCQTKVTCALKNLKGLLPDSEKRRFHRMGLHDPIAHLSNVIRQDFIVVDHICGDLDFEEGGNPFSCDCVMASLDPVLTDAYAAYLLGYTPDDVPYIRKAEELGAGSADLAAARILEIEPASGENEEQEKNTAPRRLPLAYDSASEYEKLPRTRKILDVSYACEDADACSACYAGLVGALRRLEAEGLLEKLTVPVGIGQGMQGKTGKLGIGRCTKDFEVSIPGCPPEEEAVYEGLRAFILQDL